MEVYKYTLEEVAEIKNYLAFLLARAKGQVRTGAKLIRDLVLSHPQYKQDSVITHEIATFVIENVV